MNILYTSDNEETRTMPLETLFANFKDSGTEFYREDMLDNLTSRGWCEGLHDGGRYLVLNLAKLNLAIISHR